jgi:NADPH-dependent 2,4-dienoyl-CoA reductase/sulfur reductase-like enzyme/nitrite reductase/ring-hydroxylating ferredoxin subunit
LKVDPGGKVEAMAEQKKGPAGPDLTAGIPAAHVRDEGHVLGHVGKSNVLVVQVGDEVLAVGANCTHYRGPLAEGLIVGDTVRCPWHHACFSLRTGEHLRAPALDPIACWRVEHSGDRIVVKEKLPERATPHLQEEHVPASVVIVGGGAAGVAAADTLRREGYAGPITMVSADADMPCDRPNLSKDYLAGKAPEDWMPLRDDAYYADNRIRVMLNSRVTAIDPARRSIKLATGAELDYGALLIATGAEPVRLNVPGANDARVHYLRTFADSRAIIAALTSSTRAVVIGASFIGLEVAASLRTRGIETHVVAPEARPLEKGMGQEAGDFIRRLHDAQGVVFHLNAGVTSIDARTVTLTSGTTLDADIVIVGIGVRPVTDWIQQSGIAVDRGISVNEYLETSQAGIFAAGDNARWPDPHTGEPIRVEHWVLAERMGQAAARNILGHRQPFDAVPFFWSQHYDVTINYAGYAASWDAIDRDGDLDGQDCTLRFRRKGRTLAIATIGRDLENLRGELALEQTTAGARA